MAIKKSTKRNLTRIGALAGATVSLATLVGCNAPEVSKTENEESKYEQVLDSQQAQIDELKGLIEQMQGQLDQANQDIKDLNADNLATKKLLMNYINELTKKCEELSNKVANVENNSQELSQDVADLTNQFNSLKEVVNSLQNSNLENSEWLKSLETSINKLTIQFSVLNTFSRYNKIEITGSPLQPITIYSDMNGSYVEDEGDRVAYYDVENSQWFASSSDRVYSNPTKIQNYVLDKLNDTSLSIDYMGKGIIGGTYWDLKFENNDRATIYIQDSGDLSIVYYGDFYYGLTGATRINISESNKVEYDNAVEYATSNIDSYINYQNYNQALDATFDVDYMRLDAVQKGQGDDGKGYAVVSDDKVGMSVNGSRIQQAVIYENGIQKSAWTDENGNVNSYKEKIGKSSQLELLKKSLLPNAGFGAGTFMISFDKNNQEYIIKAKENNNDDILATFHIDENGKIESLYIQYTYTNGSTFTSSAELTELSKSQFNQSFAEIVTQYNNLIELNVNKSL